MRLNIYKYIKMLLNKLKIKHSDTNDGLRTIRISLFISVFIVLFIGTIFYALDGKILYALQVDIATIVVIILLYYISKLIVWVLENIGIL